MKILITITFSLVILRVFSQQTGGHGDGFAVGQLTGQQLSGSVVSISVLYLGNSGDGYASDLGSSFTLQGSFNYSGGRGDGHSQSRVVTTLTTNVAQLYQGGEADGFATAQATALLSGINASFLYAGGTGAGFSAHSSSSLLSGPLAGIYDGGVGDGYAALFTTDLLSGGGSLAVVFGGGIGDGASKMLSVAHVLNGIQLTMYNGGLGDGTANGTFAGILFEAVLPVDWLSFEARVDGSIVLLTWSTATELNNDYFEVEKSLDGMVFRKVDELAGAGNSNEQKHYASEDNMPWKGINYYRVKQVDYDGVFDYSETKQVLYEENYLPQLTVYPNPIPDRIVRINFTGAPLEDKITIRIYNLNGRLMKSYLTTPISHLELPLSWPDGQYSMVIQAGNLYLGRKLIIADR
ncbi:MAG: T9SS type A sorting domain-containing protein [Cyclobacteriaceae bacterium]